MRESVAPFGSSRKNWTLQYLRAAASVAVLLYHASYYVAAINNYQVPKSLFGPWFGTSGVSLFFVISGALMATLSTKANPAQFIAHRLARIYPAYWLVAGGVLWLRYLSSQGAAFDLQAFLLIPGGQREYQLGIEWTLPFELTFYIIVWIAFIIRGRSIFLLGLLWVAAILFGAALFQGDSHDIQFPSILMLPFSQSSLGFALGLMVPALIARGFAGSGMVLTGLVLLIASVVLPEWSFCTIPAGWTAVVSFGMGEQSSRVPHIPLLVKLGDWSFALYLCHVPTLTWIFREGSGFLSPAPLWCIGIVASLLIASAVGSVDLKLYKILKGTLDRTAHKPLFLCSLAVVLLYVGLGVGEMRKKWRMDQAGRSLDVLGQQFARNGPSSEQEIRAAAEQQGLQPLSRLTSGLENIAYRSSRNLLLSGWAFSSEDPANGSAILVFTSGTYSGHVWVDDPRADVLSAFHLDTEFLRLGFHGDLISLPCSSRDSVHLVFLTKSHQFGFIALPPAISGCPR